jgi:integrase
MRKIKISNKSIEALEPGDRDRVISGNDADKPRSDLKRPWQVVTKRAGLEGVRIHDLRHSFASLGAGSGLGLPIIGKLLGHATTPYGGRLKSSLSRSPEP